jgi:hypothetical protein
MLYYLYFFAHLKDLEAEYLKKPNSLLQSFEDSSATTLTEFSYGIPGNDEETNSKITTFRYDASPKLSQLEEYLVQQIASRKFLKFFPVGRARSLEEDNEDDISQSIFMKTSEIEKKISRQQEKMFKQHAETTRALQQLFEQHGELQKEVQQLKNVLTHKTQ